MTHYVSGGTLPYSLNSLIHCSSNLSVASTSVDLAVVLILVKKVTDRLSD